MKHLKICFFSFIFLFHSVYSQGYPYICNEPSIIIETSTSIYEIVNCTPTMKLFKKYEDSVIPEYFLWEFLHPIERNNTGGEVPLIPPTPDLPSDNSTVYTFWAHSISPFIVHNKEIGTEITFITPTTYIVTYRIVNETYIYTVNNKEYLVTAGGMKVEFFVNDWVFRNDSNTLDFPFSISSTTGMKNCSISHYSDDQDQLKCLGRKIDFLEFAQTFTLINDSIEYDFTYRLETYYFDDDYSESSDNNCDNDNYPIKQALFIPHVKSYNGILRYDPDVSLLLSGKNNGNNCESSEQLDKIIIWLSISFSGLAIILSLLFIAIILTIRPIGQQFFGNEGFRIWNVRNKKKYIKSLQLQETSEL